MEGRGRRDELFERTRRDRNRFEATELSPGERLALSSQLLELASMVFPPPPPPSPSPTDEPPEHWLALIRRLRSSAKGADEGR